MGRVLSVGSNTGLGSVVTRMSNSNASDIVAALAPGGTSIDVTYVPGCSTAVSFSDYVLSAAGTYDVRHWVYYRVSGAFIRGAFILNS